MSASQQALIDMPRKVVKITATCPPDMLPGTLRFAWPQSVRRVWRRPEAIPVSEWAERHRVMEVGGPRPGAWDNNTARYLQQMMDAYTMPYVRDMVACAPPQTGKTEIILNCLGYIADRAPGPALVVYQVQDVAREMCTGRVRRMFEISPKLKPLLTGKQDDLSSFNIKLRPMQIHFAWATSISQLSNKSIRYLFLDEVDKYEVTNKTEAGPVSLARKRTRAYKHTSKTLMASSPSTSEGEITTAMNRTQARFIYAVRCPDCLQSHVMYFSPKSGVGGVRWPEGMKDAERMQSEKLALYYCPHCGVEWDDYKRDRAVRAGQWIEKETGAPIMAYLNRHRPRSIGFHYSALISPLVSLSEVAAKFVLATQDLKTGRIDAYKDWLNGYMAEVWEDDFSPRKEESILALRDERNSGELPDTQKAAVLIASVDTQDDGFWYEIRAWGYGQACESWQIRQGFAQDFTALDKALWIPYEDSHGNKMYVSLAGIDSQGHRTREVYEWCIANRGRTVPINGEQRLKMPFSIAKIEKYPGTDIKIPGGLQLLHVNTKYYKDDLHRKLSISRHDEGAWHMNAECSEEWARQMCAEYVNDVGIWVCPKGKPNHAFDVSVYSFCLADFVGTRYIQPEESNTEDYENDREQVPSQGFRRKRW